MKSRLIGYQLLHEGILALSKIESNGIHIDMDYCNKKQVHLKRQVKQLYDDILNTKEGKLWNKIFGIKTNLFSGEQLSHVLKELGYKFHINDLTDKGNYKTGETTLEKFNVPFLDNYVRMKRLQKCESTYLSNFITETVNGFMHPFFHLHTVITYRGSSSNPNFQNIPVRIKEIKKVTRNAIIPRNNNMLLEIDFKGIEVMIAYCYHKDPVMYEYLTNKKMDMHRDTAMDCYQLKLNEMTDDIRYAGKNCFVFPQFYGSYYVSCALNLWNAITKLKLKTQQGIPLKEHLKTKGINNQKQFENHIQKVENTFWNVRFKVYTQWKKRWVNQYYKQGYFDMLSGFRCQGVMRKNEVINYPVQGAAFHCLMYCLIQIQNTLESMNLSSKIIGQIHDSIVMDVNPDEYNTILTIINRIMTKEIMQNWKWIAIPLQVEIEVCKMNDSWLNKKQVHFHSCKQCRAKALYKDDSELGKTIWDCPLCGNIEEEIQS